VRFWFVLAGAICGVSAHGQFGDPAQRMITVTGDAEIKVPPDRALVTLGVETRNRDLAVAKSRNDLAVRQVIEAARGLGIDAADIQTDYIQVEIRYNSDVQTVVDHYVVQKAMAITIRDVAKFEALLSAALGAGANHVHDVEFFTSELRKYRDQARALAIKAAQEKARDMAAVAGLHASEKPLGISGYSYGGGSWYGRWHGRSGMMAQNVVQTMGNSAAPEGTIALGKISVTASVSLTFRLE
jgi:uncharacterized protein